MADYPYNTSRWQRLRTAHLARYPLCEGCDAMGRLTPANTVDHRVPISEGGPAFPGHDGLACCPALPAHDGLASYCPACHSAKTSRGSEAGVVRTRRALRPRKGCDADGNPLDPAHPWSGKSLRADRARTDPVPKRSISFD